mmetsp:Transcript_22034/g.52053  ORF Transcript_22034/g.52053 Transcript_22034/m.52053 type:complete len:360 (+) Transcript_22034:124-1203(+)
MLRSPIRSKKLLGGSDEPLRSPPRSRQSSSSSSSSGYINLLCVFVLVSLSVASYKITISAFEDMSRINNLRRPLQSPPNSSPTTTPPPSLPSAGASFPIDPKSETAFDNKSQLNLRRPSQSPISTEMPTYSPTVTYKPSLESFPLDEVWPRRPEWKEMDYHSIREDLFNCDDNYHDWPDLQLPTEEQWSYFKQVYRDVVNSTYKYEDVVPSSEGYSFDDQHNRPPYYAAKSDIAGRGLFASRFINKGEKVHDGPRSSVEFPSADVFRDYIFSLTRNRACDVLAWSWTQIVPGSFNETKIYTAFDISILMNDGYGDSNVGPKTISDQKKEILYALRDIKRGEEILLDYDNYKGYWSDVGL